MKIHFLKTIWSDCIVLQEGGCTALIDTGFAEDFPMISEYLHQLGISEIAFILLTHFHRDHYGNIPALLDTFHVKKVYLKAYSGLDSTTAWGTPADDAYRQSEMQKYLEMQQLIRWKSHLIQVEEVSSIPFGPCELHLYSSENSIQRIYDDASRPETFHKIAFSENQNSLAVFFKAYGKTIFLGGDILDQPSSHPVANFVNHQIAEQIHEEIDLYKVPHHATYNTGTPETLAIYKPKTAVITNESVYVSENSDALLHLKQANPNVRILLTETQPVVLSVPEDI